MANERRYAVIGRRRFHYPGYVTRARLVDRATGHTLDFSDAQLAEQLARWLEDGVDDLPAPALKQYAVVRSPRGNVWLRRTPSSGNARANSLRPVLSSSSFALTAER